MYIDIIYIIKTYRCGKKNSVLFTKNPQPYSELVYKVI